MPAGMLAGRLVPGGGIESGGDVNGQWVPNPGQSPGGFVPPANFQNLLTQLLMSLPPELMAQVEMGGMSPGAALRTFLASGGGRSAPAPRPDVNETGMRFMLPGASGPVAMLPDESGQAGPADRGLRLGLGAATPPPLQGRPGGLVTPASPRMGRMAPPLLETLTPRGTRTEAAPREAAPRTPMVSGAPGVSRHRPTETWEEFVARTGFQVPAAAATRRRPGTSPGGRPMGPAVTSTMDKPASPPFAPPAFMAPSPGPISDEERKRLAGADANTNRRKRISGTSQTKPTYLM